MAYVTDALAADNEKLRKALASCLRDRREAYKVYLHATSALGPNDSTLALMGERDKRLARLREPKIPAVEEIRTPPGTLGHHDGLTDEMGG